jgi:hypothetical protein
MAIPTEDDCQHAITMAKQACADSARIIMESRELRAESRDLVATAKGFKGIIR